MFMKHYAPNRCLYIKVAKLRTGVGSHTYKIAVSKYQGRCEQRSEVFVTNFFFFFFLWGGGGVGLGGQGGCERRIEVFVKIQKKNFFGGGSVGGVGVRGQSGYERRIEVFVKIQKKKIYEGGGGGWWGGGGGGGEGSGWM